MKQTTSLNPVQVLRLFVFSIALLLGGYSVAIASCVGADKVPSWAKPVETVAAEQFHIAEAYYQDDGLYCQDFIEAARWYGLSAEQGYAPALNFLEDQVPDPKEAIENYKFGMFRDNPYAIVLYGITARQGDIDAQFLLGFMHVIGDGAPRDYREAVKWYLLAAEQGHVLSQTSLGNIYQLGKGAVPQDYEKAIKWHMLAAEQGDSLSLESLASMYLSGNGVAQDSVEGMRLYHLAAKQGDNSSIIWFLGEKYAEGKHVAQDYKEAFRWMKLAAENNAALQLLLGEYLEDGTLGWTNLRQAAKYYELAAKGGPSVDAQIKLGAMYEFGRGVLQDHTIAHMWYNVASKYLKSGAEARGRVTEKMTPEGIFLAQTMARECLSNNYQNCGY